MSVAVVRLRHRFEWTCPGCQSVQVADYKSVPVPEDVFRRLHHLDAWEPIPDDVSADGFVVPDDVTCAGCNRSYATLPPVECDQVEEE